MKRTYQIKLENGIRLENIVGAIYFKSSQYLKLFTGKDYHVITFFNQTHNCSCVRIKEIGIYDENDNTAFIKADIKPERLSGDAKELYYTFLS